jgi:hypothetical protein
MFKKSRFIVFFAIMFIFGIYDIKSQIPKGWKLSGKSIKGLNVTLDKSIFYSGKSSVHFTSDTSSHDRYAWMNQFISASDYFEKRIRLSGYIKTKDLDGYACLSFYYVDNNGETVGETRGFNRSISGTLDWTKDEVVIDVPKTAKYLSLGIMVIGNNKIGTFKSYPEVWIDNLNIDEVSKDVILTDTKMNTKPINLDFEE